jgi:hypothetical protein
MLGLARRKMTARVLFCVKKNPPKKGGGGNEPVTRSSDSRAGEKGGLQGLGLRVEG